MLPKVMSGTGASHHREAAERRPRHREELQAPLIAGHVGDDERPVRTESNAVGRMIRPVSLPIWTILRGTSAAAVERVDRVGTPVEDEIRSGRREVAGGNLFEDAGGVCRQGASRRTFFHLRGCASRGSRARDVKHGEERAAR